MPKKVILDLCAGSGAWSEPYKLAGYEVVRVDLPTDVRLLHFGEMPRPVHGILMAPPCTAFSYARNRYPPTPEEFRAGLSVVDACLRAVAIHKPKWWALENPRAKLRWFLGPPDWTFRHWQYGDPAEKPTCLWGHFNAPMYRTGTRTKPSTWKTRKQNAEPWDAVTPAGFAQAFFEANR